MPRDATRLPETAGHLLVAGVATAAAEADAAEVFRGLAGRRFNCLQNLHVVDAKGRLAGIVPLTELVAAAAAAPGTTRVGQIARPVQALHARDRVVPARLREAGAAPPVVDAAGRLLGCIPPRTMLALGRRLHSRDVARLAGILHDDENGAGPPALEAPAWRRALARLPWLLLGLVGSAVAAALVAGFEERLTRHIAVAFFIPAVVYLADAVGTQTEAAVVRGLAFRPRGLRGLLAGEVAAGAIIGAVLGALTLPLVWLGFGDWRLAAAVALAVLAAGSVATICGLLFPWLLARAGADPAFGSGPVATVIQDVLSLLLYFAAVQLLLPP